MSLPPALAAAVRDATGRQASAARRVSGGSINEAWRVELDDGTPAFVKTRTGAAAAEYATEAAGLRWLADARGLPVPAVLGAGADVLVLEWVAEGGRGDPAALGRGLARVHAAGAPAFGGAAGVGEAVSGGAAPRARGAVSGGAAPRAGEVVSGGAAPRARGAVSGGAAPRARGAVSGGAAPRARGTVSGGAAPPAGAREVASGDAAPAGAAASETGAPPPGGPLRIGPIVLSNDPLPDWPAFYAERRVLPLLAPAADRGALSPAGVRAIERVCERLSALAGPPEPPARLHGDLWSGNVLWGSDGRPWLIDPAAYGGHREVDLAMLRLFGDPGPAFLTAYEEHVPLAAGHDERLALWQLFPLLVHAVLFGGGYGASAERAARVYA